MTSPTRCSANDSAPLMRSTSSVAKYPSAADSANITPSSRGGGLRPQGVGGFHADQPGRRSGATLASTQMTGRRTHTTALMGAATTNSMRSGAASAMDLGTISPTTRWMKATMASATANDSGRAAPTGSPAHSAKFSNMPPKGRFGHRTQRKGADGDPQLRAPPTGGQVLHRSHASRAPGRP